jgi:hypothetical protein
VLAHASPAGGEGGVAAGGWRRRAACTGAREGASGASPPAE